MLDGWYRVVSRLVKLLEPLARRWRRPNEAAGPGHQPADANTGRSASANIDTESLFADIGRIVVLFQALENAIWQLGVTALGLEDFDASRSAMLAPSFHELCRRARRAVFERLDDQNRAASDYRSRVDAAFSRCDAVRLRRNAMIHSAYLFIEGGDQLVAVVRSDIRRSPDGLEFGRETLESEMLAADAQAVAALILEIGQLRVQLVHWL